MTAVKRHLHETGQARLRIIPSAAASRSKAFHAILKSTLFLYKHGTFKKPTLNSKFEASYKAAHLSSDKGEHECSGITQGIFMTRLSYTANECSCSLRTHKFQSLDSSPNERDNSAVNTLT